MNTFCRSLYLYVFLFIEGLSWSWSYGSWIYNYLCNETVFSQNWTVFFPQNWTVFFSQNWTVFFWSKLNRFLSKLYLFFSKLNRFSQNRTVFFPQNWNEKVVSSNPVHGQVYSIQHNAIKFVNDLRQDGQVGGGFLSDWQSAPISSTNILLKVTLNIINQKTYLQMMSIYSENCCLHSTCTNIMIWLIFWHLMPL